MRKSTNPKPVYQIKKSQDRTLMILGLGLLVGCQEQNESDLVKKARLVGQDNIELKKQLKLKDQEIQEQKDLVEQCRQEIATGQQQASQQKTPQGHQQASQKKAQLGQQQTQQQGQQGKQSR